MSQEGWRRYLPDRSQLVLLAVVLAALFALVSFINLAVAKSAALAGRQAVLDQISQLEERNQRLRSTLSDDQNGKNIVQKALQYFGLVARGQRVVLPQGSSVDGPTRNHPAGPPFWLEWWKLLVMPVLPQDKATQ